MTIPAIRISTVEPTIDREARTIRATVATRALARDMGILQTENCVLDYYRANPVVQLLHGRMDGDRLPVVGRAVELVQTPTGIDAVTQFADNEMGRDTAYLYGLNEAGEVYCRGWSFGWRTISWQFWTVNQAREYVPSPLWDERMVAGMDYRDEVWVATASEMTEFSVVPVGADRYGLSRAYGEGMQTAGRLLHTLNMREIAAELRGFSGEVLGLRPGFVKDFQTLGRDGNSSAAALGDSGELLAELRGLADEMRATK